MIRHESYMNAVLEVGIKDLEVWLDGLLHFFI